MKTFFIGAHLCARCHGDDPNCYVCQSLALEEEPTAPEDDEDEENDETGDTYPDTLQDAYEHELCRADYLRDQMKDRQWEAWNEQQKDK